MDPKLEAKVDRFRKLSRELRLQALLGYAKRFPELPDELRAARDRGLGRVEECQTPLYLWIGLENGTVRIHADAPRDAPTVRGFVGFLVEALAGAEPAEVADLPEDLMDRMGLTDVLGVQRTRGLGSVIRRIRGNVARAAEAAGPSDSGDSPEGRGAA
jgi:cysteine desulfuration protein SufE